MNDEEFTITKYYFLAYLNEKLLCRDFLCKFMLTSPLQLSFMEILRVLPTWPKTSHTNPVLEFVLILVLISLSKQNAYIVLRASCLICVKIQPSCAFFFLFERKLWLHKMFSLSLSHFSTNYTSIIGVLHKSCLFCHPFRKELDATLSALLLHKSVSFLCVYFVLHFDFLELNSEVSWEVEQRHILLTF